jgi:hypothetical protein
VTVVRNVRLRRGVALVSAALAALVTLGAAPADAATTLTWTGASSSLVSDPDNWVDGVAPAADDSLRFPAGAVRTTVVNDLPSGTAIGDLTLEAPGYALSGAPLTVGTVAVTHSSGTSSSSIPMALTNGNITVATGARHVLSGAVTTTGLQGVTKSGGGTLVMGSTDNSYPAATFVNGGILQADGNLPSQVFLGGGTLTGRGTLQGSGVTAQSPSRLDPGTVGGPDILTYANSAGLTLNGSTTVHVDLDGPTVGVGYDRLKLTNGSALFNPNGATLEVELGYVPTVNTSFQIVSQAHSSPITGRFNGISQFGSLTSGPATFSVGYFNSGIILTVTDVTIPTYTWDGGGTTDSWSEAANWADDEVPLSGSQLVFPADAPRLSPVNDLPGGFDVTSLVVGGPGYDLTGNGIDLRGSVTTNYASGSSTLGLDVTVSGAHGVFLAEGGTLAVAGAVTGGTLNLTGGGRVSVTGAVTSSLTVGSGVALSGSGTTAAVSAVGGSTLAPRGVLSTGNLTLAAGSRLQTGLDGTTPGSDVDQVSVTGSATLDGALLATDVGYDPTPGDQLTIIDNDGSDPVTGTFADLPEGATFGEPGQRFTVSYVGGTGNDVVLTATDPTTTTVTSEPTTSVRHESVTFTATTLSGSEPVPGGTLSFLVGGSEVQAAVAVEDGAATFTTDALAVGDAEVTAEYSGTSGYSASTGSHTHTVGRAETTTALDVAPSPVDVGEEVSLTATVAPVAPGAGVPAGEVTFSDGDTVLGTETLVDGVATLATSDLASGERALSATYAAGDDFLGSTGEATLVVARLATQISVTSSPPSSVTGESVTFTATVTDGDDEPLGQGTVRFLVDGEEAQATAAMDEDGQVAFTTDELPVGATTVAADYTGTSTYSGVEDDISHTVAKAGTATTLEVNRSVLTATVDVVAPGSGTPTGTVSFTANGAPAGSAPLVDGVATLSRTTPGSDDVTATYAGDDGYEGSTGSGRRTDPTITATVSSAKPRSGFGWYRTPVDVRFACAASTGTLTAPCPAPVTLGAGGKALSVTRTVTTTEGASASVTVTVNIDRARPAVRVKLRGKRRPVCRATDALSGIASCKVKVRTEANGKRLVTATAVDRAGNTRSKIVRWPRR